MTMKFIFTDPSLFVSLLVLSHAILKLIGPFISILVPEDYKFPNAIPGLICLSIADNS